MLVAIMRVHNSIISMSAVARRLWFILTGRRLTLSCFWNLQNKPAKFVACRRAARATARSARKSVVPAQLAPLSATNHVGATPCAWPVLNSNNT